ncbi:twin-arginine translocation signal domain-containing protein, partial [Enterococcus faecium]
MKQFNRRDFLKAASAAAAASVVTGCASNTHNG